MSNIDIVYDLLTDVEILRAALESIWEIDPGEPYETIHAMQKIALTALERTGFAAPYYTKEIAP